ncbi:dihydroorotase [Marichromatium gracile]|uniref:dihydroorotase n=1 Tax=Marichromatium gracile TaxID=1048 RepID=UPI001F1C3F9F|nr:dihydroorotase [Marichromatium gracile]MCF1182546.1 dihydroorotase [Marichromatium gracile]
MASSPKITIRNGRLIDPASGIDSQTDLHIAEGRVAAIGAAPSGFQPDRTLDASGRLVLPGLVDLSARLREPGHEHKATIASETRAAAASGITTLCCPPDTQPVIDTPAVAQLIQQTANRNGYARVLPIGALTRGLKGETLAEMAALKRAGCPALGEAERPIRSTHVLRRALEYAASFAMPVFLHPLDPELSADGCAHEGRISARLGLPAIPEAAETLAVARGLALAEQTGARIHFRGLSTARAVTLLAEARRRGVRASGDVSIHQLFLTEDDLAGLDANCHLLPPLRTQADREALRAAVVNGDLEAVCSDHQPHDADAKLAPFPETDPGIAALETLLPLALRLVEEGVIGLPEMIARLTQGPAGVIDQPYGRLGIGEIADVCVLDPEARWTLTPETLVGRAGNTPFIGTEMHGRVSWTLLGGRVVFERVEQD